ncbi:proton-conducting transporter membrane subunit [Flavobacterium gelidilacus]|jgi:NADH:ubiquinone oxidoreductase subunit 5 (subunit L)/multisubunit Na+/H+ antiporter MnhA subunit|uniref:proton-conducting transporter transmembrane domain-containing protein n=1 Tax=Flavobacterium gelidilacus TaxID=206041 RepID=UPI0004292903|nr:proton-conducting transporter membrane subunit [Flavobacterium gelidilacus]
MNELLQFFIALPLLGFIISLLLPERKESLISWVAFGTVFIQLIALIIFIVFWIYDGANHLNLNEATLLKTDHYEFFIDFYFDKISAVYLFIGALLTSMITTYSRYYLHREKGYKRFFNTVLFFFFGYNLAILSGNFETLFIGWEIIGISSFLLIAFYRERYLPVKNAFKVFSIYRIGDIGMILAMWASHHLFHENITFMKMNNFELVNEHLQNHTLIGTFIALSLALAAAAKSAQIPFSSWLPRAMEGPTPSSAIFYGSLSVHLGVFLMLRTFPFWEHQTSMRIAIGLMGLTTSIMAAYMAKVQSSVKSQVAYSSISQIGLIFIEVALGLETLALFHFAGNAFLRTYQLLVSPSVVSYMIREQFYNFQPKAKGIKNTFPKRIEYALYIWSLKEFKLEQFMNFVLWRPLKTLGKSLDFLNLKRLILVFIPTFLLGVLLFEFKASIPLRLLNILPELFAFIGLLFVFKAFSERKSPFVAWILIVLNHFWIALAIVFNEKVDFTELLVYLSGIILAGIVGYLALLKLKKMEFNVNLNQYLGHVYEHPKFAFFFLLAALGVTGFPITTTFIGEDLIFSHIESNQVMLAFFIASSFIVSGIAGIRIYTRLFLGPHIKTYHELPYRSS